MKTKALIIAGFIGLMLVFIWLGGFSYFCQSVFSYEMVYNTPLLQERTGIVALTGGRNRIAKAVELLREDKGERLLISGVTAGITLKDIGAREDILLDKDMQIELGYDATDTVGNAKESKTWAQKHNLQKLLVVTSFYHIPRVRLEFERFIPEKTIEFAAVGTDYVLPNWWTSFKSFWFLGREYTKYLVVYFQYKVLGL